MWAEGHLDDIMGKWQPDGTFGIESGLLDNLYNAIHSLEYLRKALKAGDCKEKYVLVLWLCQNRYEFTGRRNCGFGGDKGRFQDCKLAPKTNTVLLQTREIKFWCLGRCTGTCLGFHNEIIIFSLLRIEFILLLMFPLDAYFSKFTSY